jgi:hypothetical protein
MHGLIMHRIHLERLQDAVKGLSFQVDLEPMEFVREDQAVQSQTVHREVDALDLPSIQHTRDATSASDFSCMLLAGCSRLRFNLYYIHVSSLPGALILLR